MKIVKDKLEPVNMVISEPFERRIFFMRGKAVMIDRDLAELYKTSTKAFNQAVKRNIARFPGDFMFQLSDSERIELVTNCDRFLTLRHSTSNPYAFTEQGVAMLSSVLRSDRAIKVNIEIMRAFIKMRDVLAGHKELARKVDDHEHRLNDQDEVIVSIVEEMRKQRKALPPAKPKRKIGFSKPN